jgi:hypothetical protein
MSTFANGVFESLAYERYEPPSVVCDGDASLKGKYYGAIYDDGSMFFFIRVIGMKRRGICIYATSLNEALSELKKCNKEQFSGIVTLLWSAYGNDGS